MRRLFMLFLLLAAMAYAAWQAGWLPKEVEQAIAKRIAAPGSGMVIERFALSNGMEVILLPNARVPAVSHTLWLRRGGADDPAGKSGIAHYLEHLMFKGTPSVPSGEYSRRIEALGGQFNAFTGRDYTGYYVNIAAEHLETVMQLEADRMQHLAPSGEEAQRELEVVIEERQSRIGSRPAAQLDEQLQAAMFLHHPYRIPIIGWMHEIETLTPEDARDFYQANYHAGNLLLVVAGDVTREILQPLAEQYYGAMPARETSARDWLQEPPAMAARSVRLAHPEVRKQRWQRRYLAPSYGTGKPQQAMALSLLAEWLGGGKASVLHEALVKKQKLAVAVSVDYSGFSRGSSDLTVSVSPAAGVSFEAIEASVDELLVKAKTEVIDEDELARIQTLFKASAIYARDGLAPMAYFAGALAMLNMPMDFLIEWEQQVEAVSAEHIQAAAELVLQPERSVTGYLVPETTLETATEAPHDTP